MGFHRLQLSGGSATIRLSLEEVMSQHDDDIQKLLGPPGAGLPVFQAFLLRYMIFPVYCLTTSWDHATAAFQAEAQKVVAAHPATLV